MTAIVPLNLPKTNLILSRSGNNIHVKWYFESDDADLEEEGKMFADLVDVPIEMIAVEEFEFTFQ